MYVCMSIHGYPDIIHTHRCIHESYRAGLRLGIRVREEGEVAPVGLRHVFYVMS